MGGVIQKFTKTAAKYKYLLIVVAVGLLLLLWPTEKKDKETTTETTQAEQFSVEQMEHNLEAILGGMKGVGRVDVMLTLKTSMETIYIQDQTRDIRQEYSDGKIESYSDDSSLKTVVISGNPGSPLIVKHIYPQYQGVVVVCDGASEPSVRLKVVEATASLTGVGTDRISVVPMKE